MSQPTTTNSDTVSSSSSWNQLQEDYNLRNGAKFSTEEQKANNNNNNNPAAAAAAAAAAANPPMIEDSNILPSLPSPTKKRKIILIIGVVLTIFDLCILPIIYFYVLTYHTSLTPQYVFVVITCLYCMMTFTHYTHRCFRLWLKCSSRYGPIGWPRKWRLLEFTNINFAICATIFETLLVIGTAPTIPIIRLCAMTGATICYYFGTLFLITAFLTQYRFHLPFHMSSTPKGSLWRPALLAMLEDSGAIEGRCELAFRQAVMARYEASPLFRRMMLNLSWLWGVGFLAIAIVTTVLIMTIQNDHIAFGVGWGLPYVWAAIYTLGTVVFVKRSLKEERRLWNRDHEMMAVK